MEQLERIIVEDFGAAWCDAYEETVRAFQVRLCVWGCCVGVGVDDFVWTGPDPNNANNPIHIAPPHHLIRRRAAT